MYMYMFICTFERTLALSSGVMISDDISNFCEFAYCGPPQYYYYFYETYYN